MRYFIGFAGPYYLFGRIGKVSAREIGGRVGFFPGNHIQYFKTQFVQYLPQRKDIMHRPANPYRGIILHFIPHQRKPLPVKVVDKIKTSRLIPIAFVHAYYLATLYRQSVVRQKIRRVGKYHIKLMVELTQQLHTVAVKKIKIFLCWLIIWRNWTQ